MYKLNPQHIADLAAGKVILAYTKKEEDLPLLMAIINKASKKKVVIKEPFCSYIFFRTGDLITRNTMPIVIFPIIPLHDFLIKYNLPKEDLDRIEDIDKRLKELEGLIKVNGYTIAPQGAFNTLPVKPEIDLEKLEVDLDTALSNKTNEPLKELLDKLRNKQLRHKAEIAEPKPKYEVELVYTVTGKSNIYVTMLEDFTKDEVVEVSNLIRWVLDNQETVLKLKNK